MLTEAPGKIASAVLRHIDWRLRPGHMIERATPPPDPDLERVYLRRGLILIHVPKNGGTSVEDAIYGYRVRHRSWKDLRDACPLAWSTLPKLAVVRDPVDRFLSAFDYLSNGGRNATDRAFSRHVIANRSAESLSARMAGNAAFRKRVMGYFHFRPQAEYVCDGQRSVVDHLIPFPAMAEGLRRVAGIAPDDLKRANRTEGARTRKSTLRPATLDRITELYRQDVVLYRDACEAWESMDAVHWAEARTT